MPRTGSVLPFPLLLICLLQFSSPVYSQRFLYGSMGLGTSMYQGDLSDGLSNLSLHPSVRFQAGMYVRPGLSIRGVLSHGEISADDALAKSVGKQTRGLSFRSPVTEVEASVVWELRPDKTFRQRWRRDVHWSPYVTGGLAGFTFQPQALYQGEWIRLRPLGTEGQLLAGSSMKPYRLAQVAVPLGVGFSFRLPNRMGIWAEYSYRRTFTDYLDDVSGTYPDQSRMLEEMGSLAARMSNPSRYEFSEGAKRGNDVTLDTYAFLTVGAGFFLGR